jgi:hypothetical protein
MNELLGDFSPDTARRQLIDRLSAQGWINRPEITEAYLTLCKQDDGTTWQFGAHGLGPAAGRLVTDLLDLLTGWDAQHRAGPGPRITVHPSGSQLPETGGLRLLVHRRHTLTAITWLGSS